MTEASKWYEKGRESVLRKNKSGCCCLFNEDDEIVSLCAAHKEYFEEHKYKAVEHHGMFFCGACGTALY
jgi:hypothetical protein